MVWVVLAEQCVGKTVDVDVSYITKKPTQFRRLQFKDFVTDLFLVDCWLFGVNLPMCRFVGGNVKTIFF